MGDDEWTLREPGSATGSYVPPPATPDETPPKRPPLPRRQPQANWPRRASGKESPGRPASPSATEASTANGPARHVSPAGQRRLRQAESDVAAPPELPDNVRYLFKPVLTPPAAKPDGIERDPQQTTASAGSSGAPAADRAVVADLRRRFGSPRWDGPAADEVAHEPANPARSRPERDPLDPAAGLDLRSGGGRLGRRVAWSAAVLLVVVAVVGTTLALSRIGPSADSAGSHQGQTRDSDGRTGAKAVRGLSNAAIIRGQAARWIVSEISKSAIIGCDEVMCDELINQGIAASNLLVLGNGAPDPLGADILVATPALRSQFGARLATEYAPAVIASFGKGKARVDVRTVALYGAASYIRQEGRDLAARQRNGSTLLHNSKIAVAASAQPELIAGLVDSRLLVMLPALASQHPIRILGFYDRAPRSALGVPLTGAELAGVDRASGLSGASYRRWLLTFLRGQRPPFRPDSVTTALVHGHEVVVRVRFARPSPIGVLNGQ